MDKELREKLCDFLQCDCGETYCPSLEYIEQAFLADGWVKPQQQGELADCKAKYEKQICDLRDVCRHLMQDNTELTEKLATMMKLPSKLPDWEKMPRIEHSCPVSIWEIEQLQSDKTYAKAQCQKCRGEV